MHVPEGKDKPTTAVCAPEHDVCPVCLDPLDRTDDNHFLPCAHGLHTRCAAALHQHPTAGRACPVCRAPLQPGDLSPRPAAGGAPPAAAISVVGLIDAVVARTSGPCVAAALRALSPLLALAVVAFLLLRYALLLASVLLLVCALRAARFAPPERGAAHRAPRNAGHSRAVTGVDDAPSAGNGDGEPRGRGSDADGRTGVRRIARFTRFRARAGPGHAANSSQDTGAAQRMSARRRVLRKVGVLFRAREADSRAVGR